MLLVERFRPVAARFSTPSTRRSAARSASACARCSRSFRRVALGRDDRRRHADGARSAGRRGVLVLSGDADDGGRVRARPAGGARARWRRSAPLEIAIGFVMAFVASLLVVRPFLAFVRRSGFAPFAWYRIAARAGRHRCAGGGLEIARGWRCDWQWLRRRFLAGFFVTVPLVISVAALVWIFGIIDGFTAPLATRLVGRAAAGRRAS